MQATTDNNSAAPLSDEQVERSTRAGGRYAHVKPTQVHGPKSNSLLAQELYRNDPVRYRALREQFEISVGARPGVLVPEQ